ncbi:FAS-associated factor 2-like [Nilaparvata lugens]|uniref:FAS-associated factor 2-like n=1 Tax=Nilaparvata lugens TaxID=108931 RepID=UPI00193DBAAB|nr:FAS-associated factor 2-like [Nilaparvata lugens]
MDNLAMSLTSEQTDKILQFQDLTGIDNMTVCRDVLQRHSWDLEVAVQDQLNIREGRPTVFASTESQPPTVFTDTVAQHVFISPPSAYRRLSQFSTVEAVQKLKSPQLAPGAGDIPRHFTRRPGLSQSSTVGAEQKLKSPHLSSFAGDIPGLYQEFWTVAVQLLLLPFRRVFNCQCSRLTSTRFTSMGGGTFGYVVSLVFRLCLTQSTLCAAYLKHIRRRRPQRQVNEPVGDVMSSSSTLRAELRFLLVYLHKDNDEECNNFCRNTLSSPGLAEYINRSMLFWACSVSSGEGQRVAQAFQENTYPFLGVICLREHRMTIVGRILGSLEPQVLLHKLQTICVANEASLVAARADRVERNFNQTLRRQQDEAYEASLRADQQKEQMKRAEADKAEAERRRQLEAEEDERRRKEELQQRKVDLLSRIPVEPAASDADTVCVVFKLPNGQRLERRFTSTTTLQDVFNFVFCHPASPDEFEIATNFPKRVLTCQGAGALTTLADAGLKKSQVLFVYDLEA